MKESIEKLFKKMNEDKVFAEKIVTQTEKEKVIELAESEGINITLEDIDEANTYIQKALEQQFQTEGELSEEELENVAGGTVMAGISSAMVITAILSGVATLAVTGCGMVTLSVTLNADKL